MNAEQILPITLNSLDIQYYSQCLYSEIDNKTDAIYGMTIRAGLGCQGHNWYWEKKWDWVGGLQLQLV